MNTDLILRGCVILILLLAACSPPQPVETPSAQGTPTAAATVEPSRTVQETAEILATATGLPAPSPTPGERPGAISPEDVKEVIELARWGKGSPRAVSYSPDGSQFALHTALGVYFYEAESLSQAGFFPAASGASRAAVSPDWGTLAWGEGSSVRLVRTSDLTEVLAFESEAGSVGDLSFSPDGGLLALQVQPPGEEVYTRLAEIRRVSDGSLASTWDLQGMNWAFSPDWSILASWDGTSGLKLWQLPGGEPIPFPAGRAMISTAAFSPDGTLLAAAGEGRVQLWQAGDGALVRAMQGDELEVTGLAFSPDGATLAGVSREGPTHLWQVGDGSLLQTIPSGPGGGDLMAFSPDGAELALRSSQGVTLWSIPEGADLRNLEGHPGPLRGMAFDPTRQTAAVLAENPPSDSSILMLWRLGEAAPFYLSEPLEALSLALSPDGSILALGMWDGTVQLIQASDGQLLSSLSGHPAQVQSVGFSPDGTLLASSSMEEVRLWSAQDGQPLHTPRAPGGWATDLAFSPDGAWLAAFSGDGAVHVWQVSDGSPLEVELTAPEAGWEGALAFSPDGSTLALGTHPSIQIWQVPEGSPVQTLAHGGLAATSLAYSPDGALLASGLSDGAIEWWEPGEEAAVHSLNGHTEGVSSLAYSPDGLFVLSASLDGSLRLWGLSGAR